MDKHLLQLGILLFLLGLLTGLAVPKLKYPRMALASHLEAVMNGMFLVILGLIWPRIELSDSWLAVTFWLVVYAAYANWLATLLAATWGAGRLMPIAAGGHEGTTTSGARDHTPAHLAGAVHHRRVLACPRRTDTLTSQFEALFRRVGNDNCDRGAAL